MKTSLCASVLVTCLNATMLGLHPGLASAQSGSPPLPVQLRLADYSLLQGATLTVAGTPGQTLALERSSDATGPWVTWVTNALSPGGTQQLSDASAAEAVRRFYRARNIASGSPVYSVNAVGFVNVSVPPFGDFIANPLLAPNNAAEVLLAGLPNGISVFTVDASGYVANNYLHGWNAGSVELLPGKGLWFKNPFTNNVVVTFKGDIIQGSLTNHLARGWSLCSSIVPVDGYLPEMGFPARNYDEVMVWDPRYRLYYPYDYYDPFWDPQDPFAAVGQSFWAFKSVPTDWIRNYSVTDGSPGGYSVWHVNPLSQLGQVNFFTYNSTNAAYGRVCHADGTTPVSEGFVGQLYASLTGSENDLIPVGTPVAFLSGPGAGYIRSGSVSIPGTEGDEEIWLQLRVWEVARGNTYETAVANCSAHGKSGLFQAWLGSPTWEAGFAPPSDANQFESFTATVTYQPPLITQPPHDAITAIGGNVSFAVVADGMPPLVYQWYFNGSDRIPGATNAILHLANVQLANAGAYRVEVSDRCGSTTSATATLTIGWPDLAPLALTAPTSAAVQEFIQVSWAVTNQGSALVLPPWTDRLFLSTNAVWEPTDQYLDGTNLVSDLPAGHDYQGQLMVRMPCVTEGDYYLILRTDADDQVSEANETNNEMAVPIRIHAPDLVVDSVQVNASGFPGEDVAVVWTVCNRGTGAAPASWAVRFVLSTNAALGGGVSLGSINPELAAVLAPGACQTNTNIVRLPANLASGTYYVVVAVDPGNTQCEGNEGNNITPSNPISISPPWMPDLVVMNITAPTQAVVSERIQISWTIRNRGNTNFVGAFSDRVYLSRDGAIGSDTWLADFPFSGVVSNGQSVPRTQYITLPDNKTGPYWVVIKTDANDELLETNETNNTTLDDWPITILQTRMPNLKVTTVLAPTNGWSSQKISLEWVVRNEGTAATPSRWYDRIYLSSDMYLDQFDTVFTDVPNHSYLEPSQSYRNSTNLTIPRGFEGAHYLLVCADWYNQVTESNESDNRRWSERVDVQLTPPPDLQVLYVRPPVPSLPVSGQAVSLTYAVTNAGTNATMEGDWFDEVFLSSDSTVGSGTDLSLGRFLHPGFLAGYSSYTNTVPVTLPYCVYGDYHLIVRTDAGYKVWEHVYDGNNDNATIDPVNIARGHHPDLVVTNIVVPSNALPGQRITVSWVVMNLGLTNSTKDFRDRVYLSSNTTPDSQDHSWTFSFNGTIPAGSGITRSQSITMPNVLGLRWIIITTDVDDQVCEPDVEINNTTVSENPINFLAPDLQVTKVVAPVPAFSGQPVLVEWVVTNAGNTATRNVTWYDQVWLSTNFTLEVGDTNWGAAEMPRHLDPGASYTNSLRATLPNGIEGDFHFIVRTDVDQRVLELREDNNEGESGPSPITLTPPPDLQVTSVGTPASAYSGQPMVISWAVTNAGPGQTQEDFWYDAVYMSSNNVLDANDTQLGVMAHRGILNTNTGYVVTEYTVTLPIGVSGFFFFLVYADVFNDIYEHHFETNNWRGQPQPIEVHLTPPPDLEVQNVEAPDSAYSSHTIMVSYRVANLGTTVTPNWMWYDRLYLSSDQTLNTNSDTFLAIASHYGPLEPDQAYTNAFAAKLPDGWNGNYYAIVVTDLEKQVFELNRSNNTNLDAQAINIRTQAPDLVVADFNAPASALAGSAIPVSWSVRNQGLGDAPSVRWRDRVVISRDSVFGNADDQVLLDLSHYGPLAVDAEYVVANRIVEIPYALTKGTYSLFLVTDGGNEVYESINEGNNVAGPRLISLDRLVADLLVTSIDAPASAESEQFITVTWTVDNLGQGAPYVLAWNDTVYLSDLPELSTNAHFAVMGSRQFSGTFLPTNRYTNAMTFPLPAEQSGEFFVIVVTDSDNGVIEEAGEYNNVTVSTNILSVTLRPPPDLLVENVIAPTEALTRRQFEVTWTVRNAGPGYASNAWADAVYLSLDQIFDEDTDTQLGAVGRPVALLSNEQYTVTHSLMIPADVQAAPYFVFVHTDDGKVIPERGQELNNANYAPLAMQVNEQLPADLVAGLITVPANGVPGQTVSIEFCVTNMGANTAIGCWEDSVYLSPDKTWSISDAYMGRVTHCGDLAPSNHYCSTLTASLPGLRAGDYYVIIRSDIMNYVLEITETNNFGASLNRVDIDVPWLQVDGSPASGTIGGGQSAYYRFNASNNRAIRLSLAAETASTANELYVRFEQIPTRARYDRAANEPFTASPQLTVPVVQSNVYYVLVYCAQGTTPYTLTATSLPFSIDRVTPGLAGNRGEVSLKVDGALFAPGMGFYLTNTTGTVIQASRLLVVDSVTAFATFNCFGVTPGAYDLVATSADGEPVVAVLPSALTLEPGQGARVDILFAGDLQLRPNRVYPCQLQYGNVGDADTLAPLILAYSTAGARLGLSFDYLQTNTLQILGQSHDGWPEVLRPHSASSIPLYFRTLGGGHSVGLRARAVLATDTTPLGTSDWAAIEASVRPANADPSAWSAFWQNNIQSRLGGTWGDYVRFLNRLALEVETQVTSPRDVRALFTWLFLNRPDYRASSLMAGTLLESETAQPHSGIEIAAYRLVEGHHELGGVGTADANGSFVIPFLPPGEYELALSEGSFDMDRDGQTDWVPPRLTVRPESDLTGVILYAHSEPTAPSYEVNSEPALAVDRLGTIHLAWLRDGVVWHAYYKGGQWVGAQPISTAQGANVSLRATAGVVPGTEVELIAVWEQGTGNKAEIVCALGKRQPGAGFAWSSPFAATSDQVQDSAPAVEMVFGNQALITYLKRNVSIQDDTDVYYALIDLARQTLVWTGPGGSGLGGAGGQYSGHCGYTKKWGPYAAFGTKAEVGVDIGVDMTQSGCSLEAAGGAEGSLSIRVPGWGGLDFKGNGAISTDWGVDAQMCAWDFRGAQLDAGVSGTFVWKDGLVQCLQTLGPQGMAAAAGIRTVIGAVHRFTPFRVENGVNFELGVDFNDVRWTRLPPIPYWVLPDYVGSVDLTAGLGPYLTVTHRASDDFDLTFSGAVESEIELLPTFKVNRLSGSVAVSAQIGWFSYSHTWPIPGGSQRLAGLGSPQPGEVMFIYNPAGAVGTTNTYGTNTLLTGAALDLLRDGAPVLVGNGVSPVFALWNKEIDPAGPQMGAELHIAEFDGTNWTAPTALPGSLGFHHSAAAIYDALGRRLVVWSHADSSSVSTNATFEELQAARDAANLVYAVETGGGWSDPALIATTPGPDGEINLTLTADGQVLLVWIAMDDQGIAHLQSATWNGTTWSAAEPITSGPLALPRLVQAGPDSLVVWSTDTDPDPEVVCPALFQSRRVQGNWSAPEKVNPTASTALMNLAGGSPAPGSIPCLPPPVPADCCGCQEIIHVQQGTGDCVMGTKFDKETCTEITFYEPCVIAPVDPNEIVGPPGFGPDHWVRLGERLRYTIRFENDPGFGRAPVQYLRIRQQLDFDLNPADFRFEECFLGGVPLPFPTNRVLLYTAERVDLTDSLGIYLDIRAGIEGTGSVLLWEFQAIDPETGEKVTDATKGFLPPNLNPPEGEGFVTYSILAHPSASHGARLDAKAEITFNTETSVVTPAIYNTLESDAPTSVVEALPTIVPDEVFRVAWEGQDQENGSGIASFNVYVARDEEAFQPWLENTTLKESPYPGLRGHRYAFYSRARDNAGNLEPIPTQPDATTTVASNSPPVLAPIGDGSWMPAYVTNTFALTTIAGDPDLPIQTLTFSLLDDAPTNASITQTSPTTARFEWTPNLSQLHTTNLISVVVTDNGQPSMSATQSFVVVALTNTAPTLAPIGDGLVFTVYEGRPVLIFVNASDAEVPLQNLTFSLLNQQLTNILITKTSPTNAAFRWLPTEEDVNKTNVISLAVTDDGIPSLSATQNVFVSVLPYVVTELGTAVVTNEGTGCLPIRLTSTEPLTSLAFKLRYSADNITDITITPTEVSGLATNEGNSSCSTFFVASWSKQVLRGTQQVARLCFTAPTNLPPGELPFENFRFEGRTLDGAFGPEIQMSLGTNNAVQDGDSWRVPMNLSCAEGLSAFALTFDLREEYPTRLTILPETNSWTLVSQTQTRFQITPPPGQLMQGRQRLATLCLGPSTNPPPTSPVAEIVSTEGLTVAGSVVTNLSMLVVPRPVVSGESWCLPIELISDEILTSLAFTIDMQPGISSNWSVLPFDNSWFVKDQANLTESSFFVSAAANKMFLDVANVATFCFKALANDNHSGFFPLDIVEAWATDTTGKLVSNPDVRSGRVALLGREPLLEAVPSATEPTPKLILYGFTRTNYVIQAGSSLSSTMLTNTYWSGGATNLFNEIMPQWPETNSILFFRAYRP